MMGPGQAPVQGLGMAVPGQGAGGAVGAVGGFNMNQILEIFKMQYIMKFLQGGEGAQGGGQGQGKLSVYAIFIMMLYDHISRQIPQFTNLVFLWLSALYSQWNTSKVKKPLLFDQPTQQPAPEKKVRAFIQFERTGESTISDTRIDAVIYHVCNLPEVKSLRFNGQEMVPNFQDMLMIENDIWFEILQTHSQSSPLSMSGNGGGGKDMKLEAIVYKLSTFDHDIKWLHRFIEQSVENYEQEKKNKLGSEMYYFDHMVGSNDSFRNPLTKNMVWFHKSKFSSNRTLKNVYLRQCEELQKRVDFFLHRRDWYDSKGIPHTLGIVMWGHPGCGKTSTIKAIANETKRHIFNIMLSEIKTKEALKDLFYNDSVHIMGGERLETYHIPVNKRIYVIEDIDAMDSIVLKRTPEQLKKEAEKRAKREAEMEVFKQQQGAEMYNRMVQGTDKDSSDALDLATLLNVLDGVRETPGRIIILSTNYPERLDEALLRPGRFDMMIEYEKHSLAILQHHISHYYDTALSRVQLGILSDPSLDKKWTPAEVSQILFKHIYSMNDAIDCLVKENPETYFRFSHKTVGAEVEAVETVDGTNLQDLFQEEVKEVQGTHEESEGEIQEESEGEIQESKGEIKEEKDSQEDILIPTGQTSEILGVPTAQSEKFEKDIAIFLASREIVKTYEFTEDDKKVLNCFTECETDFSDGFVGGILNPIFDYEDSGTSINFAYDLVN